MILMFEVKPPFRAKPKVERTGPMTRLIWGWFSVAYFHRCGINDIGRAFREDERNRMLRESGWVMGQSKPSGHGLDSDYPETKPLHESEMGC